MQQNGILHGIRVIDLSQSSSFAECADTLADYGAEVIAIRFDPAEGKHTRPPKTGALQLDLQNADHCQSLKTLVASAAILLSDRNDGDLERIGLPRATLHDLNPALVYTGACADVTTDTASTLSFALLASLRHAEATGNGQCVNANNVRDDPKPKPASDADTTDQYLSELPQNPLSDADKRSLRDAFGTFATGVTVVTTNENDGTPRGFTANSFTSVSLDPPMLLVCIAKTAHSCATFLRSEHFAVNILTEDQKQTSGLFASRSADKFAQAAWAPGTMGMPILENCLANFTCSSARTVDAGDHIVLIGRIIDHQSRAGKPLGYYAGQYFSVGLEEELVSAASRAGRVRIGAILARGKQVLLENTADGNIAVPKLSGTPQDVESLKKHLEKLGVRAKLELLFAVFNDKATQEHGIFYTGSAVGYAPAGHKFYEVEDIPFHKCANLAERSMLKRYCDEHSHGSFGIYEGDETTGIVHRVVQRENLAG